MYRFTYDQKPGRFPFAQLRRRKQYRFTHSDARAVRIAMGGAEREFAVRSLADRATVRQVFLEREYSLDRPNFPRHAELRRWFDRRLGDGATPLIVDAGANIGAASAFFSLAWPGARVVAIEPEDGNVEALRRNTAGLPVEVRQAAVGAELGSIELYRPEGQMNNGFRVGRDAPVGGEPIARVDVVTIDGVLADNPDLVPFLCKIDIEGFEEQLFTANTDWFARFPVVFVEIHDWMLPGTKTANGFLQRHCALDRQLVILGENLVSISGEPLV